MKKVLSYGEERYAADDPEAQVDHMHITFHDIYRKYIRLHEFFKKDILGVVAEDGETLRDTFMDLANYGIMGVQLLDKLPKVVKPVMPRIDQVAFYSKDPAKFKALLNKIFGTEVWHDDEVVADGEVFGYEASNRAALGFNYELMKGGLEFEVLNYLEGDNWVEAVNQNIGLTHLGMHVEDIDPWIEKMEALEYQIAQEVTTVSHTNPAIKDNRRYRYVIFDTRDDLGFDLKLIQRLPYSPEE